MDAIRVSERVYWVGAIDPELRDFHGYLTSKGTTYNAYLILADQVTLVDTVKPSFMNEMMSRISSIIDPAKITRIISNHSELDHSGAIPQVIEAVRPDEIVASANGAKALTQHFHWDENVRVVRDQERVDIGGAQLQFIDAKMLHWPDSMFTFLEGDGVLFSNDAFGMHMSSTERFVDELDLAVCMHEAAKYYANILLPYSHLVTKLLNKMPGLGLDLKIIATDHGPIWRQEPEQILKRYAEWAEQKMARKAVIVFDTMWNSTEMMAHAIRSGLSEAGLEVVTLPLRDSHRSDVMTELLDAGALLVGSPTLNGLILPTLADVLNYIKGLKPKNLVGGAFGSYGWNPASVRQLEEHLKDLKVDIVDDCPASQYVPSPEMLDQCKTYGKRVADALEERIGSNGS